ncbi:MAG: class I tRNA ligase family protein, partial [Nanoarchaeota archaeon]|nr:class I tRNA ligase family protein [Nanoarchaeota archaeon]
VVGLQYLNYEGGKFSKTHKRGIFCGSLPSSNINPDILRAYLTFVIPETGDTEFKWSEFESRINSDLIGNFGNFINRILTFAYNKLDGNITKPKTLTKEDKIFQNEINDKISKIDSLLEKLELRHAFHEILLLSDLGNKYFNDQEPWIVLKENKKRAEDIIYLCVNLCKSLAIVSYPYMPSTSERIFKFLNLKNIAWDFSKEIKKINKPEILFSKLEPDFLNEFKKLTSKATNLKDLFKN